MSDTTASQTTHKDEQGINVFLAVSNFIFIDLADCLSHCLPASRGRDLNVAYVFLVVKNRLG